MATGGVLPSYPPFDPDEEISSLPQKWEEWSDGLEDLMVTCGITDHERKWSTLKFFGGEKLRKLEKQLTYDKTAPFGADPNAQPAVLGTPDSYRRLKEALTAHFAPCVNETYARFQFRSIVQGESESVDTFITRLRSQAGRCNFHAADNLNQIRDQIVFGCASKKLRRKALAENYSLDRLIQVARAEESARANAAEIEKSSESQNAESVDVLKVARRPGKYSNKAGFAAKNGQETGEPTPNPPRGDKRCFNCNGPFPHSKNKPCPARGKSCNKCSKLGHFASVCRGEKNVLAATADLDSSDDFDVTRDLGEVKCIGSLADKPHRVKISTENGVILFNPDTGADVTLIDYATYEGLKPKPSLRGTKAKLMPYGASVPLQLAGVYSAILKYGDRVVSEPVYVSTTSNKQISLLSRSASRALGLVTLNFLDRDVHLVTTANPEGDVDHPLLSKYPDICEGVGCHKDLHIALPLKEGAKHTVAPPARIPVNLLPKVKAELDRLESEGVFEAVSVDDNIQSVSRLVPVPKKIEDPVSGAESVGVRITFDWRDLNKNLEKVHHQVMTVEELKATLANSKVFSQVDVKDAFYQLPLDEESKRLTTFSTPWGLKRSTRLIQGALPSSAICHEVLRRDLEGISGAINIADNILVFGRGDTLKEAREDHDRALKDVFDMFRRTGLTINKKKCSFNATVTKFFGYVFSAEGVSPDPDKVRALVEAEPPTSKEEVRSFLGMAGFNAQFMPTYATLSEPLRNLTKKNEAFHWSDSEQKAFTSITNAISEETRLSYFDPKKETALFTDASPVGVNATLAQKDCNGLYRPVNIASRALNDTERGYHQLEREAVAMHFGCKRFKMFLQGIHFTHFIDPEPLKSMMEKSKKEAPARIEKIRLKLQGFNSSIVLVKGKHNPADYLSRHPLPYSLCSKAERESFRDIQNHLFLVAKMLPEAITVPRVREAIKEDAVISEVMALLREGVRRCPKRRHLAPYKPIWQELSIGMGILLRGERVVLPQKLTEEALSIAHKGHMGIGKTKRYLRSSVWFPKMDARVESLIGRCLPCQAVTPEVKREPLVMTPLPEEPWQSVAADIFGPLPTGEKILVVKCLRSKWPEVKIFSRNQSTNADGVITAMESMFSTHGVPDIVRTDNGPPFNSKCFRDFASEFGFQHQKVTPLWPEANGQVEAFMKCLGKVVRTAHVGGNDWRKTLNDFLMAYRATPHSSTGVSPAQVMFPGRRFKTRLPNCSSAPIRNDEVDEFNRRVTAKAKAYADDKRKALASSLSVGDTVLVRQQKRNKLTSFFRPEPYKIVSIKGSMVSARRGGHIIVRNSSFYKKVDLPREEPKQVVAPKLPPSCEGARGRPTVAVPAFRPDAAATCLESVRAGGESASGRGTAATGLESVQARVVTASGRISPRPGGLAEGADHVDRPAAFPPPIHAGDAHGDSDDSQRVAAPQDPGERGVAPAEEDSGDDDFIDAEEAPDNFVDNAAAPRVAAFHPPMGVAIQDTNFSLPSNLRHNHNLRSRPGGRTD